MRDRRIRFLLTVRRTGYAWQGRQPLSFTLFFLSFKKSLGVTIGSCSPSSMIGPPIWPGCENSCFLTGNSELKFPEAKNLDEIHEIQTKILKVFLLCYSQSPLQLCLRISIFSNSRNLLQFLQFSFCTLYRRKRKPDRSAPFPMV
jgi:hypothetical protein